MVAYEGLLEILHHYLKKNLGSRIMLLLVIWAKES